MEFSPEIDGDIPEQFREAYMLWREAQQAAMEMNKSSNVDDAQRRKAWDLSHELHRAYLKLRYPRPMTK